MPSKQSSILNVSGVFEKSEDEDIRETFPPIGSLCAKTCRSICTRKQLFKRLPILQWLPSYNLSYVIEDMVAGISVGLTVIPQGIAYAAIANLDPQYGLYSAFIGCFIYCLLGSCKDVTIGPTALMSLMVQVHVANSGVDFAILSTFLTGCAILLFGMLNLGFLVQFISLPVTAGFTSAAAITIASGQVKSLLGLPGKSNEFLEAWMNVFENVYEIRLWDSVLGFSTILVLLLLMQMKNISHQTCCESVGKYVALCRNAIVVVLGTILAYVLDKAGYSDSFLLTGNVTAGLPPFQPPPFSTMIDGHIYSFSEMLNELGSSLITLPLIGVLESIAIAKAFSKGKPIDATQEMIAIGVSNIVGSFVSSMPVTGSFTRSAVNNNSGVRTPFGGIATGTLVLLSLGLLTKAFYYIPKACLAGVIIAAMIFMVDYRSAVEIWRTKRFDIIPMISTLVICLVLGLELGILFGVVINICFLLYLTSRPKIIPELLTIDEARMLVIQPDQRIVYSSAEYLQHNVLKESFKADAKLVVLDGSHVSSIDATAAKALVCMTKDLQLQNRIVMFWKWNRATQCTLLRLDRELFKHLFTAAENRERIIKEVPSGKSDHE